MRKRILVLIVVLIILAIGGGLWRYFNTGGTANTTSEVTASGFIESTVVSISPEISGRITSLSLNEGDQVKAGDTLIKIDDSILRAQLNQAAAALSVAQANLQQAQAAQNQAKIYLDGAKTNWDNAQAILQNPLELDSQIAQARSQLDLTELGLAYYMDITGTTTSAVVPWRIAYAKQQRDGAKMVLDSLLAIKSNPQNLKANSDQMHSAYLTASAAADIADKAGLTAAKQVDQAQASLALAQVNLTKTVITSPVSATISKRNAEVGELAQPGISIYTLSQMEEMTLTIYVPEREIGLVKLGQTALVSVDSYPGQIFKGNVTFISPQAEFTPKNVQTIEERANTVFATKIKLTNAEQKLKSGMPADANILTE